MSLPQHVKDSLNVFDCHELLLVWLWLQKYVVPKSLYDHLGLSETVGRLRVRVCKHFTMKTLSKQNGKATQLRAIEDVIQKWPL